VESSDDCDDGDATRHPPHDTVGASSRFASEERRTGGAGQGPTLPVRFMPSP
jgi:hypothetical protein